MKRYGSIRFARRFDRLRGHQESVRSTLSQIRRVCDIRGVRVVELGAGTGVVTAQLALEARWVAAFDRSAPMIAVARKKLWRLGLSNWGLGLADHRAIPLPDSCADAVVAAWTLDSVIQDSPAERWRKELDLVVAEMSRLITTGGVLIIVATPCCGRRDYVRHLERAHGFERRLFKSVWRFSSRRRARAAIELFLQKAAWRSYEPHWPKDLVTLGGIWWRGGERFRASV